MQPDRFFDISKLNFGLRAKRKCDTVPHAVPKLRKEINPEFTRIKEVSLSKIEKFISKLEEDREKIRATNSLRYHEWNEYLGNLKKLRTDAVNSFDLYVNNFETKITELKDEIRAISIDKINENIHELEKSIEDEKNRIQERKNMLNYQWKAFEIDQEQIFKILEKL